MGPGVGDKCVYCPKIETLEHLFVKFFRLGFHLMYLFMAQNIEHKRKMFAHFLSGTAKLAIWLTGRDPKFWVCGPGVSLCGTVRVLAQG